MARELAAVETRFPSLDGWRGVAILLVLIGHGAFNENLAPATWVRLAWGLPFRGDTGVHIFFCLSGFLITSLLLREEESNGHIRWGYFFLRRMLRIMPVYYLYLAVVFGVSQLLQWDLSWKTFAPSLVFNTGLWWRKYSDWVLDHLWSLSVEQQFYLAWPMVMGLIRKQQRLAVAMTLFAILPVLRCAVFFFGPTFLLGISTVGSADYLLAGSMAALVRPGLVSLLNPTVHPCRSGMFVVFGLLAGAGSWCVRFLANQMGLSGRIISLLEHGPLTTVAAIGLTMAIVATVVNPHGAMGVFLNARGMVALGTISYSVYIWQQVVINPSRPALSVWQKFPLNIALAIGVGTLSYILCERWFLALRARYGSSMSKAAIDPGASVPGARGL